MARDNVKGYLYLSVANICLGLNSPLSMRLFSAGEGSHDHVSPFAMSGYRMLGAAILFWVASLFMPREKIAPKDLAMILLASVFGLQLNQILYLWGLSLTSSVDAPIIAATVPIMTMVLAMLFLGEPITWLKSGGVALGACGAISIIAMGGQSSLVSGEGSGWGAVICTCAALSYSIYLTLFQGVITKYSPITTMRWMFLFSAIITTVLFWDDLTAVHYSQMSPGAWGSILFIASFGTFVAFLCVITSQKIVRPTVVSMFNYLQPITAVVFTVAIGIGSLDWRKAVAAMAIFIGVYMVTRSKSKG